MSAIQACRDRLYRCVDSSLAAHPGLLLTHYLQIAVRQDEHPEARRHLLGAVVRAQACARPVYEAAYQRHFTMLAENGTATKELRVDGRLVIGLGAASPLESGLRLHHTYGVPVIPGSALKGLAAHYCHKVWGEVDGECRRSVDYSDENGQQGSRPGDCFKVLFGSDEDGGHIMFHDAWLTPPCLDAENQGLVLDVMTPHHGDYYIADPDAGQVPLPTDFDDPKPISFLSVAGAFLVAVSCDDKSEEGTKWRDRAMLLLCEALWHWGVGGKTTSGYGRLRTSEAMQVASATGNAGMASPLSPESSPPQTGAGRITHKYQKGTPVRITRIADVKEKPMFKADDGLTGRIGGGESIPGITVGETLDAWILNTLGNPKGYVFSLVKPLPPAASPKPKRGGPGGRPRR